MINLQEVHLALRARLEAVAEIPPAVDRAWGSVDFVPSVSRPHLESDFVPATAALITMPAANGITQTDGLYAVRWYGLTNQGENEIRIGTTAILAAFPPGFTQILDSGDQLQIRPDLAPIAGQIMPAGRNKSVCPVRVWWRVYSRNPASAAA